MENIFNLVILVVGILIFIVTSLRKAYKQQDNEDKEKSFSPFFDDNHFFPQEETPNPENEIIQSEDIIEKENEAVENHEEPETIKGHQKLEKPVETVSTENIKTQPAKYRNLSTIINNFDAKTAFIYSEIFNPKYF